MNSSITKKDMAPWIDSVLRQSSLGSAQKPDEFTDRLINRKPKVVYGKFKIPSYFSRKKNSWEHLTGDELREYLARKQEVKLKVDQLNSLQKRDPKMKQRMIIYKDIYKGLAGSDKPPAGGAASATAARKNLRAGQTI